MLRKLSPSDHPPRDNKASFVCVLESSSPSIASKPISEILVKGELSPFEHEALYKLLKKHFQLEQPSYVDFLDETLGTRVNIIFHDPYELSSGSPMFSMLKLDWISV